MRHLPFCIHQSTTTNTVAVLLVTFHMIPDMENHKGKLKTFRQETPSPSKSHPVTAVQGGYTRLARVSFFSLGTSHAWHPWQPLGTALTTAPLKKHAHNSFHAKYWHSKKEGKSLGTIKNPICSKMRFSLMNLHHHPLQQSLEVAGVVQWGSTGRGRESKMKWIFVLFFHIQQNKTKFFQGYSPKTVQGQGCTEEWFL